MDTNMKTHMKKMSNWLACTFLFLVVFCCTSGKQSKPETWQNLHYGPDTLQTMDVYLAENRVLDTPLMILVHGGGWMAGDKKDADFMKDACYAKGMNIVNINYRMGTGICYKQMMEDLSSAVRYVLEHTDEWNIRKSGFILWGGSAGAHLSLLYAYNYDTNDAISLVITLGAPTRLDALDALSGAKQSDIEGLLPIVTGKPWNNDTTKLDTDYKLASPYYGKKFKPTFLIHGEKDTIVPKKQSEMLSDLLKQYNVSDTLVILPNGGHGGENTPLEVSQKVNEAMYKWILRYSK